MKDLDAGHLFYTIYRSPDAYKAWEASKKVISDHIDGVVAFDKHALEGALSGIVVSFANDESTMSAAATISFVNQVVHNQSKDYNMQLLKKVKEVSVDDLKNSLKEFLLPIFQYDTSNNIIVTAPVKTEVSFYPYPWGGLVGARDAYHYSQRQSLSKRHMRRIISLLRSIPCHSSKMIMD